LFDVSVDACHPVHDRFLGLFRLRVVRVASVRLHLLPLPVLLPCTALWVGGDWGLDLF